MTSAEKRISRVMRSMEKRIAVLEATEFGGGFDGDSVVRPVVSASDTVSIGDAASLSVNQLKSLTMKTTGFSNVTDSSAKLFGELDRLTASYADCDFQYGKQSGSVTDNNTADQRFSSPTNYDATITGLASGTTYEFRARGVASDGDTDRGGILTFTTDGVTVVIDDFEDNDITTKSGNWDGWNGDTGSFSAVSSNAINGSYSGRLSISTSTTKSVNTNGPEVTPTSANVFCSPTDVYGEFDAGQFAFQDGTTNIIQVSFVDNGDIEVFGSGTKLANYSGGDVFEFEISNIDFGAETFDIVVKDSGGTQLGSSSGEPFKNSAAHVDSFFLKTGANDSSPNPDLIIDDIQYTN